MRAARLKKKNLVVVMLRGGMDGLTAIQPTDRRMEEVRPDIVVTGTKKLTSDFNVHPRLESFFSCWKKARPRLCATTSIPYTLRSHFDGQNLMESGGHTPYADKTGWLGRGMEASELGSLAVSLPMPLVLRGNLSPDNYYPTWMDMPTNSEMHLINSSYTKGSSLAETMERVRNRPMSMMQRFDDNDAHLLAEVAAQELKREDGPRVAVFDIGGFDTPRGTRR